MHRIRLARRALATLILSSVLVACGDADRGGSDGDSSPKMPPYLALVGGNLGKTSAAECLPYLNRLVSAFEAGGQPALAATSDEVLGTMLRDGFGLETLREELLAQVPAATDNLQGLATSATAEQFPKIADGIMTDRCENAIMTYYLRHHPSLALQAQGDAYRRGLAEVAAGSSSGARNDPPSSQSAANAQTETTSSGGVLIFSSPSGNLRCRMSKSEARCLRREADHDNPPCPQGEVRHALVRADGFGDVFCATPDLPQSPALAYGQTLQAGSIECSSAKDGIRCYVPSGEGFRLARGAIESLGAAG